MERRNEVFVRRPDKIGPAQSVDQHAHHQAVLAAGCVVIQSLHCELPVYRNRRRDGDGRYQLFVAGGNGRGELREKLPGQRVRRCGACDKTGSGQQELKRILPTAAAQVVEGAREVQPVF